MKVNLVSKSETNQILELVSKQWKQELPKIKNLKVYFIDDNSKLIIGTGITILKINKIVLKSITFKRLNQKNLKFIKFKKVNISSSQLRKI